VSFNESVLDYVQGVVLMAEHSKGQSVGATVVPLEQRAKCIAIAFACGFNQLAVVDWVTSGGRSLALLIHAGAVISPQRGMSDEQPGAMLRRAAVPTGNPRVITTGNASELARVTGSTGPGDE
jgi:hypothetical protein